MGLFNAIGATGATGPAGGASTSVSNNWTAQQNFSNPIQIGTSQSQGGAGTAQSIQAWSNLVTPSASSGQNILSRIQFNPTSDSTNDTLGIYSQIFGESSVAYGNLSGSGIVAYSAAATNRGSGPLYSVRGYTTHIGNQTDAFNTLLTVNCSITSGSNAVTPSSMTGFYVGQGVTGAYGSGIPANTYVTAVGASTITISNNATATNSSVSLTFSGRITLLHGYYCDIINSKPSAPIQTASGLYIESQVPVVSATINGTTTVTVASTVGMAAGMPITGAGIPPNTTISSITSATQFVISNSATQSVTTSIFIQGYAIANAYAIYQTGTSDKNYFAGYTTFAGINSFSTPVLAGAGTLASPSLNVGSGGVQSGLYSGNGTKVGVSVAGTSAVEFTNGANGDPYLLVNGTSTFNGQATIIASSGSNSYLTVKSSGSSANATLSLFASGLGSNKQFYISHDYSTGGLLFQYYNGTSFVNALLINTSGNVVTNQIGSTFGVKSGTNAKAGTFTLSSGVATVSNTSVTANSVIMLTLKTASGTRAGNPDIVPTAGTGFTATGAATDTSVYNYVILEVN